MLNIALKMLIGDRAKYIGVLVGLTFASMLMTQQAGIFIGLMARTFGYVTDTSLAKLWVMDPSVISMDQYRPLPDGDVYRVRSVNGVEWAVPLYRAVQRAKLPGGLIENINLVGVDDASLIGGPPKLIQGSQKDLRQEGGVIIDGRSGKGKLVKLVDGKRLPLEVGDILEINDHQAVVVGIAESTPNLTDSPQVYTTYTRAKEFAPPRRNLMSFILVDIKKGSDPQKIASRIEQQTGLKVLTARQFKWLNVWYYMRYTGIALNFGIAVLLGFFIGTVVTGQMFYNFITDNIAYFATLKAMGASSRLLIKMVLVQAIVAGCIGYGLGIGLAGLFGFIVKDASNFAFLIPYQLLVVTGVSVLGISILAALLSLRRLLKVDASIIFRS